ncbi:MAG TPA: 2-dehydropantoate 2-reductase [Vicinamibacterales bacterium]|jgi:2-dehydropantoate 2-reductase|nr:2-dehydropantoate 2-reductase [Vicinamibacterales bacterium]
MRLAIVGAGGVGGYFGGRLAAAGVDVSFLARGAHLEALRTKGLRIESPLGHVHVPRVSAESDPARIGPVDVVFFAVKLYDTDAALALLPPLIGPETVVVPFQNGVDATGALSRAVGRPHTAGGTAYVAAVIAEPGVIRHTAMDTMVFGELDRTRSPRLERLLEACGPAGFEATLSEDIERDIWTKFVRLSVFSGMTAVTRSPVGVIRDDLDLLAMCQAAALETMTVARAHGVVLPAQVFDDMVTNLSSLPPGAKSSMLEDLERGRRLELPWLSGAVVRMGREKNVETPIHRFIAAVLAPHVDGRT